MKVSGLIQEFHKSGDPAYGGEERIRHNVREKFFTSLCIAAEESTTDTNLDSLTLLAMELEAALFVFYQQNLCTKYKQRVRDICFNLLDQKNLDFRQAVLQKNIAAADLCTIEPKQMASAALATLISECEKARDISVILEDMQIMVKTLKGEILIDINDKESGNNMTTNDVIELGRSKEAKKMNGPSVPDLQPVSLDILSHQATLADIVCEWLPDGLQVKIQELETAYLTPTT